MFLMIGLEVTYLAEMDVVLRHFFCAVITVRDVIYNSWFGFGFQ
jgi:hypothetical protein